MKYLWEHIKRCGGNVLTAMNGKLKYVAEVKAMDAHIVIILKLGLVIMT